MAEEATGDNESHHNAEKKDNQMSTWTPEDVTREIGHEPCNDN